MKMFKNFTFLLIVFCFLSSCETHQKKELIDDHACFESSERSIASTSQCSSVFSQLDPNERGLFSRIFSENFFSIKKKLSSSEAEKVLTESQFEELVALMALDKEAAQILNHPDVLKYFYLRFFETKASSAEISYQLSQLAKVDAMKEMDIYGFFQVQLASKLKDPEVKLKLKQLLEANKKIQVNEKEVQRFSKLSILKQLLALPTTFRNINAVIKQGMNKEIMDNGLFDFYGAVALGLKESTLRPWDSETRFTQINPNDIINMSPEKWARIALFSSEVEAGIDSYSKQSGQAFRAFFPQLSSFMGKSQEEAQLIDAVKGKTLAEASALPEMQGRSKEVVNSLINKSRLKCTKTWCREENRHEGALRTILSSHRRNYSSSRESERRLSRSGSFECRRCHETFGQS